jgi:nucleotide-binding universal stress UspA family protein
VAVLVSGAILIAMAVALPVAVVGSAASVLFLLSFALVNIALILIRRREPDLPRRFKVPLFPWVPILGVITNLSLAIYQFIFQPVAFAISAVWIVFGVGIFVMYARHQAEPKPYAPILMEEVLEPRGYSVMIPVKNHSQARRLGLLASIIARERQGDVLALHVVRVPTQLSLEEGRRYLAGGRALMQTVIDEAKKRDVPVRTMLLVGRNVSQVIMTTAEERGVDLMLLGWPGYTYASDVAYGQVIDLLSSNPPCDLAVIRFREREMPERILISTIGGPHAPLALELADIQARGFEERHGRPATITLFSVVSPAKGDRGLQGARATLQALADAQQVSARIKVVAATDEMMAIMNEAEDHNLVIVNAPRERLLEQRLFGSVPERLARDCPKTVIMVKSYQPVRSRLARLLGIGKANINTNQHRSGSRYLDP